MTEDNEKDPAAQDKPRNYTRQVYQNFMDVIEAIERRSPLPMTQKQIQEATGLSRNVVFDICWNLVKRGWAEDAGGAVRLKKATSEKEAFIGRMVARLVRDTYGINIEEVRDDKEKS